MKKGVSIIMGSKSDLPVMQKAENILKEFVVPCEIRALSAHRTPDLVREYAAGLGERGMGIVIAAAGMAAHLPGVVAGLTTAPVIGVPIESAGLGGLDALLSIVQMPPGIPVATVTVGGAKNAALLAVAMLAVADDQLADKLEEYRTTMRTAVQNADAELCKPAKGA
ncbi:MAG: 5-(carboxyamino)imidazole ribonucleotide mutase [Chitinivibrionales bacterium]|nr:5-(carboxyamino)imidazole ribonucleotide mutase [Chitinivibrionales bacterium]